MPKLSIKNTGFAIMSVLGCAFFLCVAACYASILGMPDTEPRVLPETRQIAVDPAAQPPNTPQLREPERHNTRITTFLSAVVRSANANSSRLLWSVYPAAVRGDVFMGISTNNDPTVSGGW